MIGAELKELECFVAPPIRPTEKRSKILNAFISKLNVLQMLVNDMQKFLNQYIYSFVHKKFEKNPIFLPSWQ